LGVVGTPVMRAGPRRWRRGLTRICALSPRAGIKQIVVYVHANTPTAILVIIEALGRVVLGTQGTLSPVRAPATGNLGSTARALCYRTVCGATSCPASPLTGCLVPQRGAKAPVLSAFTATAVKAQMCGQDPAKGRVPAHINHATEPCVAHRGCCATPVGKHALQVLRALCYSWLPRAKRGEARDVWGRGPVRLRTGPAHT
jgi:hypothetical protein